MYNYSLFSAELCSTLGSYLSHTWRYNRYVCEASVSENIFVLQYSRLAAFAHTYWQRKPNKTNKNDDDFGWIFHGFDQILSLSKYC